MIDKDQKNAILAAEREFERRENLSRALAESGVILIGRITSAPPVPGPPPSGAGEPGTERPNADHALPSIHGAASSA